jgi:hypothetical protein
MLGGDSARVKRVYDGRSGEDEIGRENEGELPSFDSLY